MYQMMIIDDEEIVRGGLKKLIPWEENGFSICAEGTDGLDGLKKLLLFQPSLVLIDLKMPGIGGIEVIRRAREQGFHGEFFILTGYSDFEFAKSAISLGVKEYLLKPVDEDELTELLKVLKKDLDKKQKQKQYLSLSEKNAKQEMLRNLLLYIDDKAVLRERAAMYHINFSYPLFCVAILLRTDKEQPGIKKPPSEEKLAIMVCGLEDEIEYVSFADKWVFICKGRKYSEFLNKLLTNNERLLKLYGESYFIAMGHNVTYWEDLHYSYECAEMLSEYRFSFIGEASVTIRSLEKLSNSEEINFYEVIAPLVEIGCVDNIEIELKKISENCKIKLMKESEIKIMFSHNIFLIQLMLEDRYPQKKAEFQNYQLIMNQIKDMENLDKLIEFIADYLVQASKLIASASADNVIRRIYAYLEKNYQNDLKLETIAKMFNYNSAYLGKIFKKEMGESFNNVIDKIRIENAKKLLSETDLKVYQVSEKVGYSNIDYFYAKFKKYVGVSPKEFQKMGNFT